VTAERAISTGEALPRQFRGAPGSDLQSDARRSQLISWYEEAAVTLPRLQDH